MSERIRVLDIMGFKTELFGKTVHVYQREHVERWIADYEARLAVEEAHGEKYQRELAELRSRLAEAEALLRESFDWVGREPVPFDVPRVLAMRKRINAFLTRTDQPTPAAK